MEKPEKILFCWSGGKDSARALYEIQRTNGLEIAALLTTITRGYDRISMHGVRECLLDEQAASLGLPLEKVYLSQEGTHEEYEGKMKEVLLRYREAGVRRVVFGDIFLEDLKKYREDNLSKVGMTAIFPLWKKDTGLLSREFVRLGFKAVITCADSRFLGREFAGAEFGPSFLSRLPSGVDPCGENGEFHSFVYAGPNFKKQIIFQKGETVLRNEYFYYRDLLPSL